MVWTTTCWCLTTLRELIFKRTNFCTKLFKIHNFGKQTNLKSSAWIKFSKFCPRERLPVAVLFHRRKKVVYKAIHKLCHLHFLKIDQNSQNLKNFISTKINSYNLIVHDVPFLYPLKASENLKVFWCFQWGRERVHWEQLG